DGIRDFHVTGVQTCALPISGCAVRLTPPMAAVSGDDCGGCGASSRASRGCSGADRHAGLAPHRKIDAFRTAVALSFNARRQRLRSEERRVGQYAMWLITQS